jgi:hypothetical protein
LDKKKDIIRKDGRGQLRPLSMNWVKTMKQKLFVMLAGLCIFMFLAGTSVYAESPAIPALPQAFYGTVIDASGQPVPAGTVIEAQGTGVTMGVLGNPITTIETGIYGAPGIDPNKLIVQGNVTDGTPITFYVGGTQAQCYDVAAAGGWTDTYPFKSGEVTELNLQVGKGTVTFTYTPTVTATHTSSGQSPSGGGGGGGGGGGFEVTSVTPTTTATGTESVNEGTSGTTQEGTSGTTSGQGTITGTNGTESSSTESPTPMVTSTGTQAPGTTGYSLIPPIWGIGILVIIIIIGVGAYYYSRQKAGEEKKE